MFGVQKGNQPPGRISIRTDATVNLAGYERYSAIIIEYDIPDGVQGVSFQIYY